ncbi:hypothetical protein [Methanobrevibacter sp.]
MIPTFFNNTTIQLYAYQPTGEVDEYGKKFEYIFKGSFEVDLQPLNPESSQQIFGRIEQDTYKMYLSSDIPIESTDLIKIPEWGTFEIVGSPQKWNHFLNHTKVILRKHRKEGIINGDEH